MTAPTMLVYGMAFVVVVSTLLAVYRKNNTEDEVESVSHPGDSTTQIYIGQTVVASKKVTMIDPHNSLKFLTLADKGEELRVVDIDPSDKHFFPLLVQDLKEEREPFWMAADEIALPETETEES